MIILILTLFLILLILISSSKYKRITFLATGDLSNVNEMKVQRLKNNRIIYNKTVEPSTRKNKNI